MNKFLLSAAFIGATTFLSAQSAQHLTCATEEPVLLEQLHQNDSLRIAEMDQAERDLEQYTEQYTTANYGRAAGANYIIPIVFHVIHDGGPENISEAQIHDAVAILNRDMRKLNSDTSTIHASFAGLAADTQIEFRLAQKDPSGNCTRGINWVQSQLTHSGEQDMKDLIQWPRNKYLNVWTCAFAAGAAGYTQYPSSVSGAWGADADGIVLLHDYTGTIGTGSVGRSRTLTHEVGHWINLRHAWGNSNDPGDPGNCFMDDNVADTPNSEGWTFCNINGQSCGSLDNVQNYMEYSYCSRMFTEGQKQRMHAALNSNTAQRSNLWQPSNLTATGVAGGDIMCEADFTSSSVTICAGDSVQFFDASYHGAMQWTWTFAGGNANSNVIADPKVGYPTPGVYDVSLTATNSNGTESEMKTAYITVLPASGAPAPLEEGFESVMSLPNNDWVVTNAQQNATFELSTAAAYTGSNSVFINNNSADEGDLDELVSTTIDMSNATVIGIGFRYAYARKSSSDDDRLRVYTSKDCGQNWLLRAQYRGQTDLATVPDQGSFFTPSGSGDWGYAFINNLTPDYHVNDFRVKFWFENNGGNNLYIDDINIVSAPVGIEEDVLGLANATLVPNPTVDAAELQLDLVQATQVQVELLDMTGRQVREVVNVRMQPGRQRIPVDTRELRSGVYFLRYYLDENSALLRLVKQ